MSAPSSFQTIVYYGTQTIRVFSAKSKGWKLLDTLDIGAKVPAKVQKALGSSVLVLVSDAYCGHLQVLFPNKKAELTDEHIAEVLEKEYDIDTVAYEFASQKFTLSREQVQMSISGVERDAYQTTTEWLAEFSPKKAWVMPFGWFVSPLKSVEPVLLAIALSESEILVSHHYLGVDDAREIHLKDLVAYIKSRKGERKETHLLYLLGDEALQKKMITAVDDAVATHALLDAGPESSVFESVLDAVWEKGESALSDLLHFEVDMKKTNSTDTEETLTEPELSLEDGETLSASDLPKPKPPEELESFEGSDADVEESEQEPELEENEPESEITVTESVMTTVVVSDEEGPESSDDESDTEEAAAEETHQAYTKLSSSSSSNMARAGEARYREVPQKSSWKTATFVFVVVVLLTSLIGGAVFWSQQTVGVQQPLLPETSPTPTPIIEEEPTASESSELSGQLTDEEKEELSVLVLNATGIAGLAGTTRTELQSAGWSNIDVGNATGSYDDAVFVSTETENVISTLETDLEVQITEAGNISESGSDEYDVVIIIADEVPWQ